MEEIIDNLTVPQLKKRLNTAAVVRSVWSVIMFCLILLQTSLVLVLYEMDVIGCIFLFGTICIHHLVVNTVMTRLKLNLCAVAILLLPFANCAYFYFYFCYLFLSTALQACFYPFPRLTTTMFPFMLNLIALFLQTSIFSGSALLLLLLFRKTFLNYHKLIKRRDEYVAVCLKDCEMKHLKRMLAANMVFYISFGVFAVSFLIILVCGIFWEERFSCIVLLVPLLAIFTTFIALLFNLFDRRNICPFTISLPVLKNAIKEQQNTGDGE